MFKKKTEFPSRPKLPTKVQILQDLEEAESNDPVFYESTLTKDQDDQLDENFKTAKEFIVTTSKLKDLEKLLTQQKDQLEESYKELQKMSENIRKQATEALSRDR